MYLGVDKPREPKKFKYEQDLNKDRAIIQKGNRKTKYNMDKKNINDKKD